MCTSLPRCARVSSATSRSDVSETYRQCLYPVEHEACPRRERTGLERQAWHPSQERLEGNLRLESCQRRTEAEVDPHTETRMSRPASREVEAVGIRELLGVTIRRPEKNCHRFAPADRFPSKLDIVERLAKDHLYRAVVA